jgi:hypothetical protein
MAKEDIPAFITVDRYGDTMYTAAYYDLHSTFGDEDNTPCYVPVLRKELRKSKWRAWVDAVIWAMKERVVLSF